MLTYILLYNLTIRNYEFPLIKSRIFKLIKPLKILITIHKLENVLIRAKLKIILPSQTTET